MKIVQLNNHLTNLTTVPNNTKLCHNTWSLICEEIFQGNWCLMFANLLLWWVWIKQEILLLFYRHFIRNRHNSVPIAIRNLTKLIMYQGILFQVQVAPSGEGHRVSTGITFLSFIYSFYISLLMHVDIIWYLCKIWCTVASNVMTNSDMFLHVQ